MNAYRQSANVPGKASRILHIVLVGLFLILLRVWYLSVVQYDERAAAAQAPTRRTVIEPARRASIRDRFGLPLALNKIQYNAAVNYSQIQPIASWAWETGPDGKRVRKPKRREHIRKLSELLAAELNLDADELEDRIHAEAAYYDHVPYLVKKDISEQEYYRLKMLETDWPGLLAQRIPKRHYPYERAAGDIVGYMGAIDANTYQGIIHERKSLQRYFREYDSGQESPLPFNLATVEEARERLRDIDERAYAINDHVGKAGVEAQFEEDLRGYHGKKRYYVDSKGNYLRELPGQRQPIPGRSVGLTLSLELQEHAEKLLAQNEHIRHTRVAKPHRLEEELPVKEPWIKGGAIVAMDPNNGEIVALASWPRFDPNDFVSSGDTTLNATKKANIRRWFETDDYLANMWDGKRPLQREVCDTCFWEESVPLSWSKYLDLTLYEKGDVVKGLKNVRDLNGAVALQRAADRLIAAGGQADLSYLLNLLYQENGHQAQTCPLPAAERERIEANLNLAAEEIELIKFQTDHYLSDVKHTYDKVLLIDLCRMLVNGDRFNQQLLLSIGDQSLSDYRRVNQACIVVQEAVHQMTRDLFHTVTFKEWRKAHEKTFLKDKRREEVLNKRYAKPYTEHLDAKEKALFQEFWATNGPKLVLMFVRGSGLERNPLLEPYQDYFASWYREIKNGAHQAMPWHVDYLVVQNTLQDLDDTNAQAYLSTMRSYQELNRPLYGRYRQLRWEKGQQYEKQLAAAFYPTYGFGYGRSIAYRQATPQGSIFKIVTAYEALVQRYIALKASGSDLKLLNPLKIMDQPLRVRDDWIVGYTMDGQPIPQFYKGGLLPKTQIPNIGELDVVRAIEVSSNSYFALLTSDVLESPLDLAEAARSLSYGQRTGIQLPGEIAGKVPSDLDYNRNGLYSLAIGQHSLVVTPLQTATMLSTLANGGKVFQPKIIQSIVGTAQPRHFSLSCRRGIDYRDSLLSAGIDFPLFLSSAQRMRESRSEAPDSIVERHVLLPSPIRSLLLEGMHRVASRYQTKTFYALKELYAPHPEVLQSVIDLRGQLVGKTSTAESLENFGPDRQIGTRTYNHTWFGTIVFDGTSQETVFKDPEGRPELVVVVYLRYGSFGRDAVPIATSVASKWREIKKKQSL